MMMHQHTKFCYRQLSSLEDTVQAKTRTQGQAIQTQLFPPLTSLWGYTTLNIWNQTQSQFVPNIRQLVLQWYVQAQARSGSLQP